MRRKRKKLILWIALFSFALVGIVFSSQCKAENSQADTSSIREDAEADDEDASTREKSDAKADGSEEDDHDASEQKKEASKSDNGTPDNQNEEAGCDDLSPRQLKGNRYVTKLMADYAEQKAQIASSDMTQVQKKQAYAEIYKTLANSIGRQRVTIIYPIRDVEMIDKQTFRIRTYSGIIKHCEPDVRAVEFRSFSFKVQVPNAAAMNIEKGDSFTVIGNLSLHDTKGKAPPQHTSLFRCFHRKSKVYRQDIISVAIRNNYIADIDGRRVKMIPSSLNGPY